MDSQTYKHYKDSNQSPFRRAPRTQWTRLPWRRAPRTQRTSRSRQTAANLQPAGVFDGTDPLPVESDAGVNAFVVDDELVAGKCAAGLIGEMKGNEYTDVLVIVIRRHSYS